MQGRRQQEKKKLKDLKKSLSTQSSMPIENNLQNKV